MTETPNPTPQSGELVIFKKEDGTYRVSQITGEITEPSLFKTISQIWRTQSVWPKES